MVLDDRKKVASGCGIVGVVFLMSAIVAVALTCSGESLRTSGGNIEQETALGERIAPSVVARYGGEDPDKEARQLVSEVGGDLVLNSDAGRSAYHFHFHDLADEHTVNAFSLPGGQIFVTRGLLTKLTSRGQLAAVLAHECGHVIERSTRVAESVFTIQQEIAADRWAVNLTSQAGYDPRALLEVLGIFGSPRPGLAFLDVHPTSPDRVVKIQEQIAGRFPNGVPTGLKR